MKKRFLTIVLCGALALSMIACGNNKDNADTQNPTQSDSQSASTETPSIEELADYSDMSVVLSGDYAITDEVLDAYFTNTLYGAGVGVIKVTDRDTVQEGDIVKADYTGYLNGVAFEGGAATNQWIDVSNNCGINTSTGASSGGFIDGFTDGLLGAKIEEKVSSEVTFPEKYSSNEDLAGQLTTFEFVVHEIYTEVTPENITDAFVAENLAETYEVSTVAEFMAFLEKELAYNYTMNYLIENSAYNIPEKYLYSRLEDYQDYFVELYCTNVDLETYLSYYGYTIDQIQADWLESIQAQIKAELIFDALVKKENVPLDEEGHQAYIQKILSLNSSYFPTEESIYKYAAAGNIEAGELYLKNQTAYRDYFLDNYTAE